MVTKACFTCLAISTIVLSIAFISLGIVGLTKGPDILEDQVIQNLPLTPYSDLSSWITPPVPVYLQFWLWECLNPEEVLAYKTPRLQQIGPFTYLEHRLKNNIVFNENHTLTYRQNISYTFQPQLSVANDSVEITMVNAFLVTLVTVLQNDETWKQELLNIITSAFNETVFTKHTVAEWLWGYEDPILKKVHDNPILGSLVPDDKFGFFYGQNGSDDGLYTIYTG